MPWSHPILRRALLPLVALKFLEFSDICQVPSSVCLLSHRLCQCYVHHPDIHRCIVEQIHISSSAMRSRDLLRPTTPRTHTDRTLINFRQVPLWSPRSGLQPWILPGARFWETLVILSSCLLGCLFNKVAALTCDPPPQLGHPSYDK